MPILGCAAGLATAHAHGVGPRGYIKLTKILTLFSSMSRSFPCSNRRFWLTVLVVVRFSSNSSFAYSFLFCVNSVRPVCAPPPTPLDLAPAVDHPSGSLSLACATDMGGGDAGFMGDQ